MSIADVQSVIVAYLAIGLLFAFKYFWKEELGKNGYLLRVDGKRFCLMVVAWVLYAPLIIFHY
jgi:hypothetical protein